MSELSRIGKIIDALKLAKTAEVGCEFTHSEAVELLSTIRNYEEAYELLRVNYARERIPDDVLDLLILNMKYLERDWGTNERSRETMAWLQDRKEERK